MAGNQPLIVQPLAGATPLFRWTPTVGPEALALLEHGAPAASRTEIQNSAAAILAKGVPPTSPHGQETGLVIGYVQSGKTLSFETVTALGRDNGFPMVIVLAGTKTPLLDQSTKRLRRDLRLEVSGRPRKWVLLQNPENDETTVQTIRDIMEDWADPDTPDAFKKTVLVTVLKQYQRLQNLTDLLQTLVMNAVPVLIIDDEADQASLNTEVGQGQESRTYRHLSALRQALPLHTYLQYTATPQAPLLISIVDAFSPGFVQVLNPGPDYTGGRQFFIENRRLIRVIPPQEVPSRANPLTEPPPTLVEALLIFMVGVAVGLHEGGNDGNRSMLVHPSQGTTLHQEYLGWVRNIFEEWRVRLTLPDADPDRQSLIEDLQDAYNSLADTVGTPLPGFADLIPMFRFAFRQTRLLEVNTRERGTTPQVDWRSAYGWILVGGQSMDRGFTVEGLTVTYMPRGVGTGNADAVQQRARFFGYKRPYLGFCRVYLEQGALNAFDVYVEHEEDIRQQLLRFQNSGQPLSEWKRAFILDASLRPCRANVLEFDYMRGRFSDNWFAPRVVQASEAVLTANRAAVSAFTQGHTWVPNPGHTARTDFQKHLVADNLPLADVMNELLVQVRLTGFVDSQKFTGLLLQLTKALEDDLDETCVVYQMSPATRRRHDVNDDGEVANLFQGEAPVMPVERRGQIYPGDRAIKDHDRVTVQIHTFDLTRNRLRDVVVQNVPALTVWVPARLARGWVNQHQPDQSTDD